MMVLMISHTKMINPPAPFIYYDQSWIEIGSVQVLPTVNNLAIVRTQYVTTFTRPVPKMARFPPNSYNVFFGIRKIDQLIPLAAQGWAGFGLVRQGSSLAGLDIQCGATKKNKFNIIGINYLLVHEVLGYGGKKHIYGHEFDNTPWQTFTSTQPKLYEHIYPLKLPTSGYRMFLSVHHLEFYRTDLSNPVEIFFKFKSITTINATHVNLEVRMGNKGQLVQYGVTMILIADSLLDPNVKKNLKLSLLLYPTWGVPNPNFQYMIPLTHDVFADSFFVGFSYFRAKFQHFCYEVYADTFDNTLNGISYDRNSQLYYQGIAYYGYNCSAGYYFNDEIQQCDLCPGMCTKCALDIQSVPICLQCGTNFVIAANKLQCECVGTGKKLVGSVCENFDAIGLPDCTIEVNPSGNIQCLACVTTTFREVVNNQCVCKQGYEDIGGSFPCQEICGDGLIFNAKCDDGNLIDGDGCHSDCTVEPGFWCQNQPSFCKTLFPLSHKITRIQKLEGHMAQISLELFNTVDQQPYPIEMDQFQPESTYLKLFLIDSLNPTKEIPLNAQITSLQTPYKLSIQFDYTFTIQDMKAKIVFDYSKTRYTNTIQPIPFVMKGSNYPLVYTSNLATYKSIEIAICVGTMVGMVGLLVGLFTPKFIGIESLLTLQLIFYSQLLIKEPLRWPAGFLYLKYLKLASGYNDFFLFSSYDSFSTTSIKFEHLQMKKSFIENFNLNFVILALFFVGFLIVFCIRVWNQRILEENLQVCKGNEEAKQFEISKELKQKTYFWMKQNDRAFWMISNVSVWLILPIVSAISAQLSQVSETVAKSAETSFVNIFVYIGPFVAITSILIVFVICLNNFQNLFISEVTFRKILFRTEERTYKKLLFIYLLIIGSLIIFFNDPSIFNIPMSIFVLILQIIYTLALLVIHPYKQSLRVHSVTLIINQCVYLVFLVFINLINMVQDMDELLIIILGYFITGCCGFLMLLTTVRLYYELRYGEALEKQIQKERQKEEELEKKRKEEKLERKKRQFELEAKMKQNAKEIERGKNQFLYENQVRQEQANDLMQWLENKNWEAEEKEKYYFKKFAQKPLEWLRKNEKQEFSQNNKTATQNKNQNKPKQKGQEYNKTIQRLRKESNRRMEQWQKKLQKHYEKIKKDANYSMNVKRSERDFYFQPEYELKD